MLELSDLSELKHAAELLTNKKEILAVEYLQKKRAFGKYADLDEMASYKTKIRPEEPPKKKEGEK